MHKTMLRLLRRPTLSANHHRTTVSPHGRLKKSLFDFFQIRRIDIISSKIGGLKHKKHGYKNSVALTALISATAMFPLSAFPAEATLPPATNTNKNISLRSSPFLNSESLVRWWTPVTQHILATTGLNVSISSPAHWDSILQESYEEQFDLFIIPDHMIPLLLENERILPLIAFKFEVNPVLIFRSSEKIKSFQDLRNKCIALPPAITLFSVRAKEWLASQGLDSLKDYQILTLNRLPEISMAVLSRRCDAGITPKITVTRLSESIQSKLSIEPISVPDDRGSGLNLVAKRNLNKNIAITIQNAMLSFSQLNSNVSPSSNASYYEMEKIDQEILDSYEQQFRSIKSFISSYLSK